MALLTILSLIGTGLLSQSSLLSLTQNEIYALTLTFLFLTYAILMLSLPQSWVREIQPSFTITRKETALPDRLMKRIKTVFQMERFQEKERKKKKMLTVMSIVVLILLLSVL